MKPSNAGKPAVKTQPTLAEIGTALEISSRRVSQLRLEGMPVDSIQAATAWRDKQRAAKEGDSSERLRLARIRLVDSQREKVDIENRVRSGELVERGAVFASSLAVTLEAKRAFLNLLGSLPPELVGLPNEIAIFKILRERFHTCLQKLSDGEFSNTPEIIEVIESFKSAKL